MESKIITSDMNGLNQFVRGLNSGMVVRVGIFGDKTNRKKNAQTNAEIGFMHEFGTTKIPRRSFLRMPIFQKGDEILALVMKAGPLKKIAAGKMVQVLSDIGVACEAVVLQAFASAGWGSWPANSPSTIRRKKSGQPLIDTGQLRRSISSAVVSA